MRKDYGSQKTNGPALPITRTEAWSGSLEGIPTSFLIPTLRSSRLTWLSTTSFPTLTQDIRTTTLGNLADSEFTAKRPITSDVVLKAAAHCINKVETAKKPYRPLYVGRNLYHALDSEKITDTTALNEALAPFWKPFGDLQREAITEYAVFLFVPPERQGVNIMRGILLASSVGVCA